MKINDLIQRLEKIQEEHGNLEVERSAGKENKIMVFPFKGRSKYVRL